MTKVPIRLERPPLVEAILELRFGGSPQAVGDLLPGLLFPKLRHLFGDVQSLDLAAIPREMRLSNPDLLYRPHIRMTGKDRSLLIGDRVVAISRTPPYSGWGTFREMCSEVLGAIRETGVVESVERFSFKCVNILDLAGRKPFALLNGELRLAQYPLSENGFRLRAEIDQGGFLNVVELAAVATIEINKVSRSGLLLSLDTLKVINSAEFWPTVLDHIDSAHGVLKEMFFSLLAPKVVEEFKPTWSGP